ncbi:MAG: GWxTD domain-containing protein [Actinobacteria bacterium]|nr:GWxTD domain-containing protein [Actinomycetota bacterium]
MTRGRHGPGRRNNFGGKMFFYQVYNFADTTDFKKSRADFQFSVVNDILTFVKSDSENQYRARYEVGVTIYNKNGEALTNNSISNTVTVSQFEETNSRINPHRHKISFSLPPGKYNYIVNLYDEESKASLQRKHSIDLRSFSPDQIRFSDIVFADEIKCVQNNYSYTPNLQGVFNNIRSSFAAYFEIYPPQTSDSISVNYRIYDKQNKQIFSDSGTFKRKDVIAKCITFKKFIKKPGEYVLMLHSGDGIKAANARRKFNVFWGNMSFKNENLDVVIRQLRLIVNKDISKQFSKASREEKKKLLDQFWEERDPTPGTPQNELRDEFFRRIDFANKNFSEVATSREGWQTDRGKVYIKNGPPDQVERQATDIDMPSAEIWYYTKLNKRYIFSDRSGNGSYRLVKIE